MKSQRFNKVKSSEEDMDIDIEINESIPEETEESLNESSYGSEDYEPLARFRQRTKPNKSEQVVVRGCHRGITRGLKRTRGGRRISSGGAAPEQKQKLQARGPGTGGLRRGRTIRG